MISEARRLTRIFIINQTLHWFMIGIVIPVLTLAEDACISSSKAATAGRHRSSWHID